MEERGEQNTRLSASLGQSLAQVYGTERLLSLLLRGFYSYETKETWKGNCPNYNSKKSLILILILKLHYCKLDRQLSLMRCSHTYKAGIFFL